MASNPDKDSIRSKLLRYIDDARLLAAKHQYEHLLALNDFEFINDHKSKIDQMLKRANGATHILHAAHNQSDDWILSNHHFGVDTHYKIDDDGLLLLKMEGNQHDVPLFEQLAVVYEVSLFSKWAPFCSSSSLVSQICKNLFVIVSFI
jgi:hypothetical protein